MGLEIQLVPLNPSLCIFWLELRILKVSVVFGGHIMRTTLNYPTSVVEDETSIVAAIPLWDLKSILFIPHGTSHILLYSSMEHHRCSYGPVVQVTTGVSSSWGYRALSVVLTWTFLTSQGAMLLECRFKQQT